MPIYFAVDEQTHKGLTIGPFEAVELDPEDARFFDVLTAVSLEDWLRESRMPSSEKTKIRTDFARAQTGDEEE